MNAFEKAQAAAKKLKDEEDKQKAKDKAEAEWNESAQKRLSQEMEEALASFDGKKGIKRRGNALYKKDRLLGKMEVRWATWENPNYDYKVEESGYELRYEVYDERGNVRMTGCGVDSFAEQMAIHLK